MVVADKVTKSIGTRPRGEGGVVKVVFIASLSHSGSTLLDLMLNAHPDVTSVGELKQLGASPASKRPIAGSAAPAARTPS